MKVVLTGATGFVGAELLARLARRPEVETVTCLSRRPLGTLPPGVATKARVVLHDDFGRYDADLVASLADHSACLWALGGKASDIGGRAALERVTHTFTLAFARAMAGQSAFTLCYLSGMGADPAESAWLPWERATRHLKGRTERDLAALQSEHPQFCAHSFRPGGILPGARRGVLDIVLAPIVVRVGDLADAMIAAATEPGLFRKAPLVGNAAIKRLARAAIARTDPERRRAAALSPACTAAAQ